MTEILWHGRGGQGAFTAAKLLGAAYSLKDDNSYALSFPSFGPERRGAPIRAFTKLSDSPIGDRSEIGKADFDIFLDDTLFTESDLKELAEGGLLLLNTKKQFSDPRIVTFDGDALATEILGRPITNTVMLGAFCALFDGLDLDCVDEAIRLYMEPRLIDKNIAVVRAAAADLGGGRA